MSTQDLDIKGIIKTWGWRLVRAGYSKRDFSAFVGVSYPQLASYINGKVTPLVGTVEKIEKGLRDLENGGAHSG